MMLGVYLIAAAVTATAPVPSMTDDWWSYVYDFPTRGIKLGELSVVEAEILVNKRGTFKECVGHVHIGNPQMGPYVCSRLKKRGMFDPARGPDGKRMFGVYRTLIVNANVTEDTTFKVTRPSNIRLKAQGHEFEDFEIQFMLDASGRVSDCSLIEEIGLHLYRHKQIVEPALVESACAAIPSQMHPVPPKDKNGAPIATVQNALVVSMSNGHSN